MKALFRSALSLALLLVVTPLWAQQPATPPSAPSVTFKLSWPQARPWTDYTITVAENGATHFSGVANAAENNGDDAFQQDFTMTEANRQKIFDLAKAANYFEGQFESKQKNVAQTGKKTLEYHSGSLNNSASFNYSANPNIQQLAKLFQAIAQTLDFGRKLAFQSRFDKLGMDACLQQLTELQASGYVEELQSIEPVLRKIADDPNVMHIARTQAKQLLKASRGTATAATKAASQP